jgi:hypothetical protein
MAEACSKATVNCPGMIGTVQEGEFTTQQRPFTAGKRPFTAQKRPFGNGQNRSVLRSKLSNLTDLPIGVGSKRALLSTKLCSLGSVDQSWGVNGRPRASLCHLFQVALILTFFQIMDFSRPKSFHKYR